jgi:flagella basal body P-ring formation protein FlgA
MNGRSLGLGWLLLLAAVPPGQAQAAPRAARDLTRGLALSAADMTGDPTDARILHLVGWVTRRAIRAGEPLREPAIGPPQLVRAGETVSIRLVATGMVVARTGTAMMAGALGDRVRIRLDDQHSLTGVVSGPKTVRIQ